MFGELTQAGYSVAKLCPHVKFETDRPQLSACDTFHFRVTAIGSRKPSVLDTDPKAGIPLRSDVPLWPKTGVTCPDMELAPKATFDLPRLLPPMLLVKFKFAITTYCYSRCLFA